MLSGKRRGLLRGHTKEEIAEFVRRAADIGISFADGTLREQRVLRYAELPELIARFASPLPGTGISDEELLDHLREIASWSVAQSDERYLAFPDTGDSVAGLLASVVSAFLNQNLIAYDRSAPAGSVIEAQLITWLRQLIGYDTQPLTSYMGLASLGGMWTSGGNMSNHVAIAAALATRWPETRTRGLAALENRPAIVLASGLEHFSYLGAAQVLGLGADSLLWSRPRRDYTSDVASIEALLDNPPEGIEPFMVVGVAGNCRTTGIDDLAAIVQLSAQRGLWCHVDACHGGSLLFSERLREVLAGIEHADSVSLDPHKGMFVSYPSSYVLFKDPATLGRFARYPDRAIDPGCLDLGLITPFYGSRGFESLRLWALIQHLGRDGIASLVEDRHRTFQEMSDLLQETGYFTILGSSDFYRCAFVFCPEPALALIEQLRTRPERHRALRAIVSRYTAEYCERLYRSGRVAFDLFSLQDLANTLGLGEDDKYQVMGMCVGHPEIAHATKAGILKDLTAAAQYLMGSMLRELRALTGNETPTATGQEHQLGPAGW